MTTTKFRDANGPHDDAIREEILHSFSDVENWSASNGRLLARAKNGWWIFAERVEGGLVSFAARKADDRRTFWMNGSSVRHLRACVEKQTDRRWKWPGDEKAMSFVAGGGRC